MVKPSKRRRQKRRDKRLHEELIECYRGGRWGGKREKGYKKRRIGKEYQFSPKQEPIKIRSGGTKYQTDNLQPLIRFLNKNTGKYWDKVYAQLCQGMNKDSLLGQHLFDHLFDFVETQVYIEKGKIIGCSSYGGPRELKAGYNLLMMPSLMGIIRRPESYSIGG